MQRLPACDMSQASPIAHSLNIGKAACFNSNCCRTEGDCLLLTYGQPVRKRILIEA